jgi:hypothetical protein
VPGGNRSGLAFFARIGAFVCWQGEGYGNNGGSNVLALVAARAGSGQLEVEEHGQGEKEDTVTRQWGYCRAVGRGWTTSQQGGGGGGGAKQVGSEQHDEGGGGGGGRRKASGWWVTQQEGHHLGG